MSDSLMAFQPSIDEPSNIRPSSSSLAQNRGDHGQVLPLALGVGEAKIDPSISSLDPRKDVFAVAIPLFSENGQG
jgi:hypothetical protein